MRHDEGIVPSYYEDHLLERVSLLELRLAQTTEHLKLAFEFINREVKSFEKDHTLLQSFFEAIQQVNPELSEQISKNCLDILNEKKTKLAVETKQNNIYKEILAHHDDKQAELFTHLVKEGVKLLDRNEEKQAFSNLERAAMLSPRNVPLLIYIAENLFRTGKMEAAKKNLEKAYEIAPLDEKVILLLGVLCADDAEAEIARKLLSVLANNPKTAVCVNYVWAMLAAFEKNWTESLAAFKEAVNRSETAELNYLIGCVYFRLAQYEPALRHLQKAVSLDIKYADAWFMQSLIYTSLNNRESAENTRQAAFESKEAGAQCLEFLKGNKQPDYETPLPFLHFDKSKKLLSNGSLRLTKFFREQIL
jgi:tetratricopeptide (TPR) repeat protein